MDDSPPIRAYRYTLRLRVPLSIGGRELRVREGILLEQDGTWGDAAPLPGYSHDTLPEVLESWQQRGGSPPPALGFALACLGQPWDACRLPIAALLRGEDTEVIRQAEEIADSPFMACKLKVGGHDNWQQDLNRVLRVRAQLRDDQQLRLDANRSWRWDSAVNFARGLGGVPIEFIEEPVDDPERLEDFYEQTQCPYALDESLAESRDLREFPRVAALVLKPTKLGPTVVQQLLQLGKPVVWSACYESGVGIARIAQWATRSCPQVPAGLDTYAALSEDVLATPLRVEAGCLVLPRSAELLSHRIHPIESP